MQQQNVSKLFHNNRANPSGFPVPNKFFSLSRNYGTQKTLTMLAHNRSLSTNSGLAIQILRNYQWNVNIKFDFGEKNNEVPDCEK